MIMIRSTFRIKGALWSFLLNNLGHVYMQRLSPKLTALGAFPSSENIFSSIVYIHVYLLPHCLFFVSAGSLLPPQASGIVSGRCTASPQCACASLCKLLSMYNDTMQPL